MVVRGGENGNYPQHIADLRLMMSQEGKGAGFIHERQVQLSNTSHCAKIQACFLLACRYLKGLFYSQ